MALNVFNFSNYHTITLYMADYNTSKLKVTPLTSLGFAQQENVKVKVLESNGLDIVRAGEKFITDVELDPDVQRFCHSIDPARFKQIDVVRENVYEKEPMKRVDYTLERYWALTSRLRGYHVTFLHTTQLADHPIAMRRINKIEIEALLGGFCRWEKDSLEEEECEEEEESIIHSNSFDRTRSSDTDDVVSEFSSSSKDSLENPYEDIVCPQTVECRNQSYFSRLYHEFLAPVETRESREPAVKAIEELFSKSKYSHIGALLVIEYNEGQGSIDRHVIHGVEEAAVVDFYDEDDVKCCTVLLFSWANMSAWDLGLHSDEGAYDSGVNVYGRGQENHGIVLMGEQNGNNSENYATALYDNIIVPDLANEDVLTTQNS